jgi:hypothetical protein
MTDAEKIQAMVADFDTPEAQERRRVATEAVKSRMRLAAIKHYKLNCTEAEYIDRCRKVSS